MRFKKFVPVHVEERVVSAGVTCDGCGKPISNDGWDQTEITLGAKIGESYGESDMRTAYDLDVCGPCFTEKVIPALAGVGLVFRVRSADDDDREWAK